jgi:SAM-dependent methyltransferase
MSQPTTYRDKNSTIYNLRLNRFRLFKSFLSDIRSIEKKEQLNILDVGGTVKYWKVFEYTDADNITIINLSFKQDSIVDKINLVAGDATNMNQFQDQQFDVVFSNSVIEHVGSFEQQLKMSQEVQRVGKYFFIQTPNYYFPIEPHYRFPFFVFLPYPIKEYLIKHYYLRHRIKRKPPLSADQARELIDGIRLLKKDEFNSLFSDGEMVYEKFYGLNKSFMCHSRLQN